MFAKEFLLLKAKGFVYELLYASVDPNLIDVVC